MEGISNKDQIVVELFPFSFEDYSEESKALILNKRVLEIGDFLQKQGLSTIDIASEIDNEENFDKFIKDKIGGVKVKISY